MATWDFIQKQILLGDASTGKSSLLVRLTDSRFLQYPEATLGVEFGSRLVSLDSGEDKGKLVKLQIWDTAGQESFRSITRSYYRGALGALLIFSLTSRPSFLSLPTWLSDLRTHGEESLTILLVGTKSDAEGREVEEGEARAWAGEMGLEGYVETSAKEGTGVEEAFNVLTRRVHEREREELRKGRGGAGRGAGSSFPLALGGRAKGGCC